LRSPLARLNVALELARRKAPSHLTPELNRMETESARINELIGRVLALARAENADPVANGETVDLTDLTRGVIEDARYETQRQHKAVTLDVQSHTYIRGDRQLLASAIENVLRNAVRYAPEASSVDVAVATRDGKALVTIRDHGPGVPAAQLDRIFEPFHRVEPARNRETGGVGLGLAIARRAITIHGGQITADNASDGGLVVQIILPVAAADSR
jgi:two-component system sensor histidine kinase CpxA